MKRICMSKVIVLVIAMVILTTFTACGGIVPSTPEKAAEDFVEALFTANPEKLVNAVPEFFLRVMADGYGVSADNKEEIINIMKESISEDDVSECVIISSKKEHLSAELDDLWTSITCEELLRSYIEDMDYYGATAQDLALIDEYCLVSVESIVDDEERSDIIFCVQYDGEWYALDIY